MKKIYSYKEIWRIAYPILISLCMEQMIGMTDTAFMGRVGKVELGASAIAGIYYMVLFMLGFGFGIGAQIIMARRNGERQYKEIGVVFYHGLYFLMGLAALAFTFSKVCSPVLLEHIIASPQVCKATTDYIDWRIFGFFFAFASIMFRAFYIGTTQTKTLTLNSVVMVLSNVAFNYVLVFGKLGFPAMGIAGAAIGSSLAELVSLLFFIVYTARRIDCRKYGLHVRTPFRPKVLKQTLNISFWTMIQNFVSISTWFIFFLFVEHLGEDALATTNVVRNISGILFMIVAAFASTCGALVSNLIGAGREKDIPNLIGRHIRMAYVLVLIPAGLFALFPEPVIAIYTDMDDVVAASVPSLWVLCTSYLLTVPSSILFHSISGTGNTRTAFLLELGCLAVYITYCAILIMGMRPDVAWCWTSEHVYGCCMLLLCYIYFRRGRWTGKIV